MALVQGPDEERHSSARRRALLYRGFASASSVHGRPRSLLRPHGAIFDEAHLATVRRGVGCAPYAHLVAAAPAEPSFGARRKLSPLTVAASSSDGLGVGASKGGAGHSAAPPAKQYADPPFKGLLSALKPTSLAITVIKCYGLSFGNLMFGAEMEEQTITDEQINAAHKASLELVLRELATTTLRRLLEKLCILTLDKRWSTKLLKVRAPRRRDALVLCAEGAAPDCRRSGAHCTCRHSIRRLCCCRCCPPPCVRTEPAARLRSTGPGGNARR